MGNFESSQSGSMIDSPKFQKRLAVHITNARRRNMRRADKHLGKVEDQIARTHVEDDSDSVSQQVFPLVESVENFF